MTQTEPTLTGTQKRIVNLLFAVQVAAIGAMEMSGPFWPIHLQNLTDSSVLLTLSSIGIYILPMLGIMLTSRFWGKVGDKMGRKWMMVRALSGLFLTQLALAYADSIWLILILRFLQGGCAGYVATAQAYGVQVIPTANRTRFFAFLQVATNVGSLLGATLGGVIFDASSFFWINFSAAFICLACLLTVVLTLPNVSASTTAAQTKSADSTNSTDTGQPSIQSAKQLVGLLLAIVVMLLFSRMTVTTNFARYVQETYAAGNWVTGLTYGLWAMGFITTASLWARYFEPLHWFQVLQKLRWVVLGCVIVAVALATSPWISLFILSYFFWGGLLGATLPILMAQISKLAKQENQGQMLGMVQSVQQFANISGIALGALITQKIGLAATYWSVAVGYVITLALITGVIGWVNSGHRQRQVTEADV